MTTHAEARIAHLRKFRAELETMPMAPGYVATKAAGLREIDDEIAALELSPEAYNAEMKATYAHLADLKLPWEK